MSDAWWADTSVEAPPEPADRGSHRRPSRRGAWLRARKGRAALLVAAGLFATTAVVVELDQSALSHTQAAPSVLSPRLGSPSPTQSATPAPTPPPPVSAATADPGLGVPAGAPAVPPPPPPTVAARRSAVPSRTASGSGGLTVQSEGMAPVPVQPSTPGTCGVPANPFGYNLCGRGRAVTHPAPNTCDYLPCTADAWQHTGFMVVCRDGRYAMSGAANFGCRQDGGAPAGVVTAG